jgi:hypothetical protein
MVVRFGLMDLQTLRDGIEQEYVESGRYGASIGCAADLGAEEIALRARQPHRRMRASTVGALRAVGVDVVRDPVESFEDHALILFDQNPSLEDLAVVERAFGLPVLNPGRRSRSA